MSDKTFAVPPAGKAALLTLLALGLVLPVGTIAVASWLEPPSGDRERLVLWGVLLFVLLLAAGLAALLQRRSVRLQGGTLVVKAALYTRRMPVAGLEHAHARIVDLAEHTELRPRWKTNGYSLPGFDAGHFRLRDRSRAFVLLTDRRRVLLLPVSGEASLLISLERPAALLDALRRW